jgi:hypothetical protein
MRLFDGIGIGDWEGSVYIADHFEEAGLDSKAACWDLLCRYLAFGKGGGAGM